MRVRLQMPHLLLPLLPLTQQTVSLELPLDPRSSARVDHQIWGAAALAVA